LNIGGTHASSCFVYDKLIVAQAPSLLGNGNRVSAVRMSQGQPDGTKRDRHEGGAHRYRQEENNFGQIP
jgi:hypothetical protein